MGREVDLKYIDDICVGNKEMKNDLISIFLEETPKIIEQIQEAIHSNDHLTIARATHKVKSSMAMFGMDQIVSDIKKIEENARTQSNISESKMLLHDAAYRLELAYKELKNEL